ncbi:glycosyltransferase family 2 protein [Kocuria sp. cx-455]|uniref:glycosyltransferase family 2 protein n=1 Tax=Kocuria sp. cx-455 TaxID=2771377 RepID=UPI003D71596E
MSSRIAVVIPACNEQDRVARCIESVSAAVRNLVSAEPGAIVCVVLAADNCTDRTVPEACEAWATSWGPDERAHLTVLEGHWASAGGARQAAANRALIGNPDWIASTDADTAVPAHWLSYQVERARSGVDAVLGTVEPDPDECPDHVSRLWHSEHDLAEGHPYIHAANMGVRAGAFAAAGGFPNVECSEDEALVGALRAHGARVESTDRIRAITSGRLRGRAALGFAYHLRSLAAQRGAVEGFADR